MNVVLARALGFGLVTIPLVTALHLVRQATAGEAVDGVVSGLFFTLLFLAGGFLGERLARPTRFPARSVAIASGSIAGAAVWLGLAALWAAVPALGRMLSNGAIFAGNSALVVTAGLVTPYLRGGRRGASA